MAPSLKALAIVLLAGSAAAFVQDEAKWPGGKLREALKAHSPFSRHQDHPTKDASAVAQAPQHISTGPSINNAGFVLMVTRAHLDKLERESVPGINMLLQQAATQAGGGFTLPEAMIDVEGVKVGGTTNLKDIEVKSFSIQPGKDSDKHTQLHVSLKMGLKAEMTLEKKATRNLFMSNALMASPEANLDLTVRLVGQKTPQIELVSSGAQFKDLSIDTDLPERLRSFSKDGSTRALQAPHSDSQDSNKEWISAVGDQVKPKVIQWLNKQLASLPAIPLGTEDQPLLKGMSLQPALLTVRAMEDGGLAVASDVNPGDFTCPEAHPNLPLDTRAGDVGGVRAYVGVRMLNCFASYAHSKKILAYKGTTNFVQTNLESPQAVMLARRVTREAKVQGNPLEKVDVSTSAPPVCSISPEEGLTCDLSFTLKLEQQNDTPTFDGKAKLGMDLSIIEKNGEAVIDPKVSRCKVDFDLEKDSVKRLASRMLFKGLSETLPPMACAIVPQLMKKVPKVHLGPEFLGSKINMEPGFLAIQTGVNPFHLKALGGNSDWGKLEGGFLARN